MPEPGRKGVEALARFWEVQEAALWGWEGSQVQRPAQRQEGGSPSRRLTPQALPPGAAASPCSGHPTRLRLSNSGSSAGSRTACVGGSGGGCRSATPDWGPLGPPGDRTFHTLLTFVGCVTQPAPGSRAFQATSAKVGAPSLGGAGEDAAGASSQYPSAQRVRLSVPGSLWVSRPQAGPRPACSLPGPPAAPPEAPGPGSEGPGWPASLFSGRPPGTCPESWWLLPGHLPPCPPSGPCVQVALTSTGAINVLRKVLPVRPSSSLMQVRVPVPGDSLALSAFIEHLLYASPRGPCGGRKPGTGGWWARLSFFPDSPCPPPTLPLHASAALALGFWELRSGPWGSHLLPTSTRPSRIRPPALPVGCSCLKAQGGVGAGQGGRPGGRPRGRRAA